MKQIYRQTADDPRAAARDVTRDLLGEHPPDAPVVLKPNVVKNARPPVTTDVRVVAGIIDALRESGIREVVVAEGSGTGNTLENLRGLGYGGLGVPLVDLDAEDPVEIPVPHPRVWDSVWIPRRIAAGSFLVSIPVLKDHSLLGVTLSLKNLVGCLAASRYAGYWTYKKSEIHRGDAHGCVADLCQVLNPAWAVVDATVGLGEHHIHGSPCSPPINQVFGSTDPLAADIHGTGLLGQPWETIRYLGLVARDRSAGSEHETVANGKRAQE